MLSEMDVRNELTNIFFY